MPEFQKANGKKTYKVDIWQKYYYLQSLTNIENIWRFYDNNCLVNYLYCAINILYAKYASQFHILILVLNNNHIKISNVFYKEIILFKITLSHGCHGVFSDLNN